MPRVMVFIDASNLNYRVDCERLVEHLLKGRHREAVHLFGSQHDPPRQRRTRFFEAARLQGFISHTVTIPRGQRKQEKQVDVALGVEMLWRAFHNEYDIAILVSGDEDFLPVVERLKTLGKAVEVASFSKALSSRLKQSATDVHVLDPIKDELMLR